MKNVQLGLRIACEFKITYEFKLIIGCEKIVKLISQIMFHFSFCFTFQLRSKIFPTIFHLFRIF